MLYRGATLLLKLWSFYTTIYWSGMTLSAQRNRDEVKMRTSFLGQHKSGTGRDFLPVVIYLIVAISRIKNWAQLLKRKLTMDYESFLLVPRGIFSSLMYSIGLTEKSYLATTLYNFRHPKPVWKLTHCIIITLASVALPSQVSQQTQFCSRKAQQTCQLK